LRTGGGSQHPDQRNACKSGIKVRGKVIPHYFPFEHVFQTISPIGLFLDWVPLVILTRRTGRAARRRTHRRENRGR
jgi:hypothetical protein